MLTRLHIRHVESHCVQVTELSQTPGKYCYPFTGDTQRNYVPCPSHTTREKRSQDWNPNPLDSLHVTA